MMKKIVKSFDRIFIIRLSFIRPVFEATSFTNEIEGRAKISRKLS